jgi:hypothetical protein
MADPVLTARFTMRFPDGVIRKLSRKWLVGDY